MFIEILFVVSSNWKKKKKLDTLQKMNGSTMVHLYHGIQLSSEEKQTMDACNNLC